MTGTTFASVFSPVKHTLNGVPYLQKAGVVTLSRPETNKRELREFLDGYDSHLDFLDYLADSVHITPGTEVCKIAGQLCYMSFGPKRTKNAQADMYFDHIIESGHHSVLEHANYSFLFYGVSRSLTHELVRHRHFSFSQVSQRYVSGKMLRFVERPEYQQNETLHKAFTDRIDAVFDEYAKLSEYLVRFQEDGTPILSAEQRTDRRKKVQQVARSILPNETEAPIVVTGNARSWRHFIELRASKHAEIEIRALAMAVRSCLLEEDELLFNDLVEIELPDGTYAVQKY